MKFLVTGGSGFIGSHIVKHLLHEDHEITVIDNLHRGTSNNLEGFDEKINFRKSDIVDLDSLKKTIKNIDGIFHQAALTSVGESFTFKEQYHKVNVIGTENIFKLGKDLGVKVVYASSSSVYGNTTSIPIREDFAKKPINPYGTTKLEDEIIAERYSNEDVEIIGLRYFNVYGLGQKRSNAGIITKFYDSINENKQPIIFGDGNQVRDFVSVEDVAKANVLAMKSNTKRGFVNIGTGVATSMNELVSLMISLSGKKIEPKYEDLPKGDITKSVADVNLARKLIDWSYETTLQDGLKKFFFN